MLSDIGRGSECSRRPILIFLSKKIGFVPWPDMLDQTLIYYWQEIFLLTLDVRDWGHSLMVPLHWFWAKSNNRTRGKFKPGVTYTCTVRLFFHSLLGRVGGSFKIKRPRSRWWKYFGRRWTGGWGSWKLSNFDGRHMCIVSNGTENANISENNNFSSSNNHNKDFNNRKDDNKNNGSIKNIGITVIIITWKEIRKEIAFIEGYKLYTKRKLKRATGRRK